MPTFIAPMVLTVLPKENTLSGDKVGKCINPTFRINADKAPKSNPRKFDRPLQSIEERDKVICTNWLS
ncbi:MAG: hypothetical protein LBS84_00560, partial [Clostridiales bacterium]|nr:hypothetical protein [Clostridiales bacterium]